MGRVSEFAPPVAPSIATARTLGVESFERRGPSVGRAAVTYEPTGVPLRHVVLWLVAGSAGWTAFILAVSTTIGALR